MWRLDARTGRILQRIQTFPRPGVIQATTHDVWFVTHTEKFSGLSHFEVTPSESDAAPEAADLPPPAPASVPAGECPTDVALEAGAVWVVDACSSELLRFDSETLNRERIIPLPEAEVAGYALEGALGYVWVADRARSTVLRVDATTSEVVGAPIKVGREPNDMTVGAGALWVVTSRGVSRIDIMSVDESISPSETDAATSAPETPTPEPTLPAGLRPRDFQKSFSMWPEQSLGSSKTACAERSSEESWRESPEGVASQFALEMLNWTGTTAMEGPPQGRMVPLVVQSGEVDAPAVGVHVRQVPGQSCWAVVAVTSDPDNDQDPGVSYSRDGANVELHFDIGEATTAVGTVHHEGGRVIHSTADDESPIRVDLGYRPSTPGYYLLVLRDENGTVFDAEGRPLD